MIYTHEQRALIAKEYLDAKKNGQSVNTRILGAKYGVHHSVISRWVKAYLNNQFVNIKGENASIQDSKDYSALSNQEKQRLLEEENLRLRAENAFLKKFHELKGGK